ncbi:MAG: hypothetical protein ACK4JX_04470 [Flavobacterium sp.]
MKNRVFKRSKKAWINEKEALQNVLEQQNVNEADLKADHTETHFVWSVVIQIKKPINLNSKDYPLKIGRKVAIENAMKDLETFEGNLKVEETESCFIISKIR